MRDDVTSLPENVGPYRIVDRIGVGGMGVVYRARDERLERWVAIKHIRPGEADMRSRERLRREARTVAGLSHPSIVQVHDIVETSEGDWIVMELVEGQTLKELVDGDALEIQQILQLAREIGEGLAEAHARGIVHRDLKTENVKVTELGHAKILDFGLAKRVLWNGQQEESLSVQGAILGTGRAMSPEQALGEEVNHLSDLFSFGTLLFEMVTRRPPFVGSSLILTMAQICTEEQPSARDLNIRVPRELSLLIDHLLQKDPLQRPQSAGEVVEALQKVTARLVSRALDKEIRKASESGDPSDTAVAPAIPLAPPVTHRPLPVATRVSSRGSGLRSPSLSRSSESTAGIFIKTLVDTSLLGTEGLGDRFGDADSYELFSRHDRVARDVLAEHDGFEIHRTEDGFLFLFERPVDAVEFVLAYHQRLAEFSAEIGLDLQARAAIHLSEVFLRENTPEEIHRGAKPFEVEGLAKLVVSRCKALAGGGQTILTREAHDMTRRALVGHPLAERKLHWRSHGRYLFRGVSEAVGIFEVSPEPISATSELLDVADAQSLSEGREASASTVRQRNKGRIWLALAALVPLTIAGGLMGKVMRFFSPPPASKEMSASTVRPALAVLGFRNLNRTSNEDWISDALTELVSTELGAGEDLRLIAAETVRRVQDTDENLLSDETLAADTLDRIQADLGSDYVVLGSFFFLGEKEKELTVQMKLQDTRNGETIVSARETGAETDLVDIVARIGDEVRAKLDLVEVPREQASRAALSTDSKANRLYFRGKDRLWSFDLLGARTDFLEATQLDPNFAQAHGALSHAWLMLGYDDFAAESAKRAWDLGRNLPRKDLLWIQGTYHESNGDLKAAIESQEALCNFYPDDVDYGLRLVELQIAASQWEEAFRTVAKLRRLPLPRHGDPRIDLAQAQAAEIGALYELVVEAASQAIEKGRPRGNSTLVAEALRLRGRALTELTHLQEATTDLDEARRLFDQAGDQLGLGKTLLSSAYLEQARRNPTEAEVLLREALAIFKETGSKKQILHTQAGLAYVIQRKGQLADARGLLEQTVQMARDQGSDVERVWALDTLSHVLFQLGEFVRAEKMMREVVRICQDLGLPRTGAWASVNLGFPLLATGRVGEARAIFDNFYKLRDNYDDQTVALAINGLGAVHYATDALPEAEAYFEEYLALQQESGDVGEQALTEPLYAAALLESGRLEEALEKARFIAGRFHQAEQPIFEASALRIAAEALRRQNRFEEARFQLGEALAVAGECESPAVRLELELTAIRFIADEDPQAASVKLRALMGEVSPLNLKSLGLEIRLFLGMLEMRSASPEAVAVGQTRLRRLMEEASGLEFNLIARQAKESLEQTGGGPKA